MSTTSNVSILLNGSKFEYWTRVAIERNLDSVDTFTLEAPLDVSRTDFADAMAPFSFARVKVLVGSDLLFTGTKVATLPQRTADSSTISISGYSLPGVLMDCSVASDSYPVEYSSMTLTKIASKVADPFGISVSGSDGGAAFTQVSLSKGEKIFQFLTKLCAKRQVVLGSTQAGDLEIRQPDGSGTVAAVLTEGEQPLQYVRPQFGEQDYYSQITGMSPTIVGIDGASYTVKNPIAADIYRPLVIDTPDVTDGELKALVNAKMGRMLAASVSYEVGLVDWVRPDGSLWEPGDIVKVEAPSALLPSAVKFEVRSVRFERDDERLSCALTLTLPGALAGVLPTEAPWD